MKLAAGAVTLAVVLAWAPAALGAAPGADPVRVGDQVIVEWKDGTTAAEQAAALASLTVAARTAVSASSIGAPGIDVVEVGSPSTTAGALAALRGNAAVASVERNGVVRRSGKPRLVDLFNDPLLVDGTQWHLLGSETIPGNTFGIDAVSAWRAGVLGDRNVYVGVVDDGVDISHPDLAANIFTNRWDPPNGIDDDHNGFVDDVHGWDFVNNDNTVFDGVAPFDFIDAHGTIIAGEIAAVQGNGLGGSGAAPGVKIIPTKFIGEFSGTIAAAIAGLDYLTDLKRRHGLNIVATNNSWGGDDANSPALQAAIQRGANAGILFVSAVADGDPLTGLGVDADQTSDFPAQLTCKLPSGADCMIATTAIDQSGRLALFANWGRRTVDLGAPGVLVMSTFPFNDYLQYDGTSQAAPLVASAIALYASRYPRASPTQTRRALVQSTNPTPSLRGKTVTGGRLDIDAMLRIAPG